jgi:hypothetical protein
VGGRPRGTCRASQKRHKTILMPSRTRRTRSRPWIGRCALCGSHPRRGVSRTLRPTRRSCQSYALARRALSMLLTDAAREMWDLRDSGVVRVGSRTCKVRVTTTNCGVRCAPSLRQTDFLITYNVPSLPFISLHFVGPDAGDILATSRSTARVSPCRHRGTRCSASGGDTTRCGI